MKILIDAGHYGKYNRSTVVPEYYESEIMWKLQDYLCQALLLFKNTEVVTTRTDINENPSVYQRGRMSKDCDLMLSLHSNASQTEKTDRVDVYCPLDGRNNSHELGLRLATAVAELMDVSYGQIKTREGKQGEYYGVLRGAQDVDCPMYFLIEHSFHTNKRATEWLLNDENLKQLALLEADVIADWYGLEDNFIHGDVNGNGTIDARDYLLAKRIYFGRYTPTVAELRRCDINGNGKIDARDYLLLKRAFFGTYEIK